MVTPGLVAGAVVLGFAHGIEPGHGWPIAAAYALDRPNKWVSGLLASLLLGIGHLSSSIAMVAVFFLAKSYFGLAHIGWMNYVAGGLLLLLGIREYRHYRNGRSHGHSHGHSSGRDHGHEHADHGERHDHDGAHDHDDAHGHGHDHTHGHEHSHGMSPEEASERGLLGIAGFAFALGFAHEEEFEIIAICTGSQYCLELMLVYGLTVIVGIVGLTLLLVAGYHRYEERVESLSVYFPLISAVILVVMGLGFIAGVF